MTKINPIRNGRYHPLAHIIECEKCEYQETCDLPYDKGCYKVDLTSDFLYKRDEAKK